MNNPTVQNTKDDDNTQPYVKAEDFPEKEMKDVSFYNKE